MDGDEATRRLTDYFRVTAGSASSAGSSLSMHVPNVGIMATDPATERAKQQRKADSRKTLPAIEPWVCTYKHRLLPSTQASLKKLIRECREFVKIDTIRETAFLSDATVPTQDAVRTARNSVLSFADKETIFPGTIVDASAPNGVRGVTGTHEARNAVLYHAFCDANDTAVRIILGAVKDPAINNQLSDLHEAHEVASTTTRRARTAIMMIDMLRTKFDSDDFVYRFLHLIDFVEFEQSKAMSPLDFIEDYHRRVARLKSAYTRDGVFDDSALNKDLFTAMFYAKIGKTLRKQLGPHIATLTDQSFTLGELTSWVERNVTMADHEHGGRRSEVAARAQHFQPTIYGDMDDHDGDDDAAYFSGRGGGKPANVTCAICGSADPRKSEHPGPCPLNRALPNGKSCPGNALTGIPHNDASSPHGQCPFGYFGPKPGAKPHQKTGGGRGNGARTYPTQARRPQASLEAAEADMPTDHEVDTGYAARPAADVAAFTATAPMERMYVFAEKEMALRDKAMETGDAASRQLLLEQADRVDVDQESPSSCASEAYRSIGLVNKGVS